MENTTKVKWTERKVLEVINEARRAGQATAEKRLLELIEAGSRYNVIDDGEVVGKMLDVCGFASLKIKAKGKFYLVARKLSDNPIHRFICHQAYRGGGYLSIFDSTMRQEMSVNIAACQGQAKVLESYGIKCEIKSRVD